MQADDWPGFRSGRPFKCNKGKLFDRHLQRRYGIPNILAPRNPLENPHSTAADAFDDLMVDEDICCPERGLSRQVLRSDRIDCMSCLRRNQQLSAKDPLRWQPQANLHSLSFEIARTQKCLHFLRYVFGT